MAATLLFITFATLFTKVAGHASIWHPSMWGFNVTQQTFDYDNRPVSPLTNYTFDQWWFHGHLDHPPNPGDIFNLPAGTNVTTELACNKGATSFFASSEGGDIRNPNSPNDPCPGSDMSEYHTTGINDVKGCALAITYESDVSKIKPEDFTVFSVNQTCVFYRFTEFVVPERMPPCPEGGCTCAFFWIHSPDSGGEQNYMNGFKCNVTGSTSTAPLAKPQVPRRCGPDPTNLDADIRTFNFTPGNCTFGAKQPFYWFQAEQNNMFEGTYSPPFYMDLYNFLDGAQDDIFVNSYLSMPTPGVNQTLLPVLADLNAPLTVSQGSGASNTSTGLVPTFSAPPLPPIGNNSSDASPKLLACTRSSSSILSKTKRALSGLGPGARRMHSRRSRGLDVRGRGSLWHVL